jgi:hypothetical protein
MRRPETPEPEPEPEPPAPVQGTMIADVIIREVPYTVHVPQTAKCTQGVQYDWPEDEPMDLPPIVPQSRDRACAGPTDDGDCAVM